MIAYQRTFSGTIESEPQMKATAMLRFQFFELRTQQNVILSLCIMQSFNIIQLVQLRLKFINFRYS